MNLNKVNLTEGKKAAKKSAFEVKQRGAVGLRKKLALKQRGRVYFYEFKRSWMIKKLQKKMTSKAKEARLTYKKLVGVRLETRKGNTNGDLLFPIAARPKSLLHQILFGE